MNKETKTIYDLINNPTHHYCEEDDFSDPVHRFLYTTICKVHRENPNKDILESLTKEFWDIQRIDLLQYCMKIILHWTRQERNESK